MKKFLLTLLLTLSSAVAFAFSGSGTEADPYKIYTAEDLFMMSSELGAYYQLQNNIDLSQWIDDVYPETGWAPIGSNSSSSAFKGTLDGNGFTISGLYINRSTEYCGLFGYAERATVKNLHISCDITGGNYTGAIMGYGNNATISNCTVEGKVHGKESVGGIVGYGQYLTATDCLNFASVEGYQYTGGLAGYFYSGSLSQCAIESDIKGSSNYTGGLVGFSDYSKRISACYVKGDVYGVKYCGGIVGYENQNSSSISDCYYEGNILSTGSHVGGIIGHSYGKVERCLAKGTVSGNDYVGGIAGGQYAGQIYSCVSICSKIISNNSPYARICAYRGGTLGSLGSITENKVTYDCQVYYGESLRDIVDSPTNGYGVADYALRRALSYTIIGWDFTDVWAIDESEGYPYLRFHQPSGSESEEKAVFDFTKPAQLSPSVTPAGEEDAGVNVTTKTFRSGDISVAFGLGSRTQTFSARVWTNDDMSNSLRVYKDGTMTISTSANNVITRISFSGEDTSSMTASEGTISGGTWTGEAQSVTFTIGASYNKINTIDVAYKHDILALTDVAPAILSGTYEPGKVKYGRVTTGNYASFCLPFDVDLSAAEGIEKVYMPMEQILYNTQTQYLMMFLKEQDMTSTVKAGTPFLAKVADSEVCFSNVKRVSYSEPLTSNPTAKALTVFDFDGKSGVLYQNNTLNVTWGGTYVATTATTGLNSFNINGSFGQHSGTLSPYRAYVMQTAKSGANSNVRGIQLNLGDDEGEVTSIFQLLNAPAATESIYDMQGRRVLNPQQGGLYIINGKKERL